MAKEYQIYARRADSDALTHVGSIEAEEETVVDDARKEFGDDWLEMVAIPSKGITWAIGEESS